VRDTGSLASLTRQQPVGAEYLSDQVTLQVGTRELGLWVPNTHPTRSRHEPVLVDEATEDFASS
jgi:hypothetical protein